MSPHQPEGGRLVEAVLVDVHLQVLRPCRMRDVLLKWTIGYYPIGPPPIMFRCAEICRPKGDPKSQKLRGNPPGASSAMFTPGIHWCEWGTQIDSPASCL